MKNAIKKLNYAGLTLQAAGDKIRLSPAVLVSDTMLKFVQLHKNEILTELSNTGHECECHNSHKSNLNATHIVIFRMILRKFLNNSACRKMVNFMETTPINDQTIEAYLDSELINSGYDIEACIAMHLYYTPD